MQLVGSWTGHVSSFEQYTASLSVAVRAAEELILIGRWLMSVLIVLLVLVRPTRADDREFFEKQVQPLLARRCYECHSHRAKELQGGLALDSRSGWVTGGDTGPAIAPGKPDESLLIKAVRRTNKDLQMPPSEKLSQDEVRLLVEWIRNGAVDPRESPDSESGGGSISRLWRAFCCRATR